MYRIILILGLLVVLYFLLRRAVREFKGRSEPDRLPPGKNHMVQDPVCLVFVPRGTAITEDFLAEKPGPTIVLPAANQAYPSLTSRPMSARSRSNSTKKKSSPTLVIRVVSRRAFPETCAHRIGCRSNTSAPQYLPLSPFPLEQTPGRRDPEPCDFYQVEDGQARSGL